MIMPCAACIVIVSSVVRPCAPCCSACLRLGTVVAAGVWSGDLLAAATGQAHWFELFLPRRGHLLEIPRPPGMPLLGRGIMEMSYTKHYPPQQQAAPAAALPPGLSKAAGDKAVVDITFTASTSASGSLLVGSSREFSGYSNEPSLDVVDAIMARAAHFLPALAAVAKPQGADVRVGLRPYAIGGLPAIGPVPGFPGLVVAAGHEGSGLCLGPATALLACQYLAGGDMPVTKFKAFLPQQRIGAMKQS